MGKKAWGIGVVLCLLVTITATYGEGINIDLGSSNGSYSARLIQLFLAVTILSLAPAIIIMVTSFTRIVVVLSFLRNSIGLQQSPPNVVLISLALFLSAFIMAPTFEKAYTDGLSPLLEEKIKEDKALPLIVEPFQKFMLENVREKDLKLFMDLGKVENVETPSATPLKILIPAFMISELRRAFEIGFLIFIPFLVIDIIIASILMSMGMMMLPPIVISLPFKVIFFVLIDGWHLLCGSLINSFIASG